jgi:AraC-like DNA-binding protein
VDLPIVQIAQDRAESAEWRSTPARHSEPTLMDALSDVLRAVRLTGAVFFDVHASEPWVAEAPPGRAIVGTVFPGAEHLISYHVVTHGTCWGHVIGEAPRRLVAGDVIVFPHGDPHVMSSAPGMRGTPELALYRPPEDGRLPFTLTMGGERPDPARIVCGFLGCDARPFNPLLSALPASLHVADGGDGPLRELVRFAVAETKGPRIGSECMLGRLSELMFVDVVRRYLASLPMDRTNWLAGLRDPLVGRALAALHRSPARAWTLESLARDVGLSRSALADRFTAFVGQPPMQYLACWRMQLAATHLLTGMDSIAEVAERVGYESEAAFSRAFKKVVGVPPGQWRRHRTGTAPAAGV